METQLYTYDEMIQEAKKIAEQYCKKFYVNGYEEGLEAGRASRVTPNNNAPPNNQPITYNITIDTVNLTIINKTEE